LEQDYSRDEQAPEPSVNKSGALRSNAGLVESRHGNTLASRDSSEPAWAGVEGHGLDWPGRDHGDWALRHLQSGWNDASAGRHSSGAAASGLYEKSNHSAERRAAGQPDRSSVAVSKDRRGPNESDDVVFERHPAS